MVDRRGRAAHRSSRRSTWHAASMPATRGSSSGRCSSPHGMASRSGASGASDLASAWAAVDGDRPAEIEADRVPGRCRGGVRGRCRRGADASCRDLYNDATRAQLTSLRRSAGRPARLGRAGPRRAATRSALLDGVGLRACRSRPRRSPSARRRARRLARSRRWPAPAMTTRPWLRHRPTCRRARWRGHHQRGDLARPDSGHHVRPRRPLRACDRATSPSGRRFRPLA